MNKRRVRVVRSLQVTAHPYAQCLHGWSPEGNDVPAVGPDGQPVEQCAWEYRASQYALNMAKAHVQATGHDVRVVHERISIYKGVAS